MQYILIVEDDPGLNRGLCTALKSGDRSVISCNCLRDAREQMMLFSPRPWSFSTRTFPTATVLSC